MLGYQKRSGENGMAFSQEQLESIRQAASSPFPFISRCEARVEELQQGFCRAMMPYKPNVNHVGTMYAGALFTLAELPGGALFLSSFDSSRFYPIVRDAQIRFRRPAKTDVRVDVSISEEEVQRVQKETEEQGKCDFELESELRDENGEVVAISKIMYQLRKIGG